MGSLIGHVYPGLYFILIGLWQLFNHIKLHAKNPKTYTALAWFPTTRFKYIELYVIMMGSSLSISLELFVGPRRHTPLDSDGTIPLTHLHNFEHSSISMSIFVYASFAIILDKFKAKAQNGLTMLLASLAFFQEFLLFHLHSTDHKGLEWQFHIMLQIIIFSSFVTTILGLGYPRSFMVSFVRSTSILFQGIWFEVIGFMLYTPSLLPKGCHLSTELGKFIVECDSAKSLFRAKSLVNIQFSWYLTATAIFVMCVYLGLVRIYGGGEKEEHHNYYPLKTKEGTIYDDIELQKHCPSNGDEKEPCPN